MTAIARPYVAAAFEYASAHQELPAWETMLETAAQIALNPSVTQLLMSPKINEQQRTSLFCEILASQLNEERKNFIRLLAENNRLTILPEIAALFKTYRATQEKTITVDVTSAVDLNADYQQKLMNALSIRLHRQVELECKVDPSLIGGVMIRAGDTVIDGTIKGKLARLVEFI